ncbi:MAG: CsbD family protein, partial [Acidobacteriota bacterium]
MNNDGTVKEELGGFKDRVVGDVKDATGAVTGDRSLQREGEAQNAMGNARQENNDVLGSNTGAARSTSNSGMVTGMFRTREDAERAYNSVTGRGYGKDDVNLLMSDKTRETHFADGADTELGSKAM